jgi:hypothetical protein
VVGVSGVDLDSGDGVVAVHERATGRARLTIRRSAVLHHAVSPSATQVCFTLPAAQTSFADIFVTAVDVDAPTRIAAEVAAHAAIPSWSADEQTLAYHTPAGVVEVLSVRDGVSAAPFAGRFPAIGHRTGHILAQDAQGIVLWPGRSPPERVVSARRHALVASMSWSRDERWITYGVVDGVVGKTTRFMLLDRLSGRNERMDVGMLRGVLLLEASGLTGM